MTGNKLAGSAMLAAGLLVASGLLTAATPTRAQTSDTPPPARSGRLEAATLRPGAPPIASHRGYRASRLLDAKFHDPEGRALGSVDDIVVDLCNGEVRHAVLTLDEGLLPGGGRQVAVPVSAIHGPVVGAIESPVDRLVIDFDARELAGLPAADTQMPSVAQAPCGHRVSARWLVGHELFGQNGQDIGKVADLVISMNRARVNFVVLKFDPDAGPPDRLLAFPLQLFEIERDGRLVFPLDATALQKLPGFVVSGWSHVLSPDELADVDRQFFADFPAVWDQSPRTLFEHLDIDQSGALSLKEASANEQAREQFNPIDRDGDQRLSKVEFVRNFQRVSLR